MKYDTDRATVLLSVRELCSLALLSGDLDGHGSFFGSAELMQKGKEVHKILESRGEVGYSAEVPLSGSCFFEGICYEVSGRADGVIRRPDGGVTVEEIKTVSGRYADVQPSLFQSNQAVCYAHFLATLHQLPSVTLRLTVCHTDTGEISSVEKEYTAKELSQTYMGLLRSVSYRAKFLYERNTERLPSIRSGKFPYAKVRDGQDLMVKTCYRSIKQGKDAFIQAPTGTGKTVSSLYPAVRALGDGYCDRIFYLTSKTSIRHEAYRAASEIYGAGSRLRTIVLTSKEQLCPNRDAKEDPLGISGHCNAESCPRAIGFYDKLGDALCSLLSEQNGYPRKTVEEVANEYGICPYEFQLELSSFCDIIICDYNSVFDPTVALHRFFGEENHEQDRYVLLVDEAHNLPSRACGMYSAELSLSRVREALESMEVSERPALSGLLSSMEELRALTADSVTVDEQGNRHGYYLCKNAMLRFGKAVSEGLRALEKRMFLRGEDFVPVSWGLLLRDLKKYEKIAGFYDERYLTFVEEDGEEIKIRQVCLDPAEVLSSVTKKFRSSIFFSATLTPTDYFCDVLGGDKRAVKLTLPSPFESENFSVTALTGISTRLEDRKKSCRKLVSALAAVLSGKRGNYIAYFPSYDYMESVAKAFSEKYPNVQVVVQERGMGVAKKERFLEAFSDDGTLRLGFCVLGGSFAEGVDLPGKRLIGTVIVGVGLPSLSSEGNILKEYYDVAKDGRGFEYAYVYPGMNRVLQAAGRVIRTESDRGVVVLIDDRYETPLYRDLFPEHWKNVHYARNFSELAEIVHDFWSNGKK